MTPTLETSRLLLRPLQLTDAEEVQPLFAQWEIVRHLNARVPWPFPYDGVRTFYRDSALPAIERGEQWHWMLTLKDDPGRKIIGSICLVLHGLVNRGFWIALPWQGQRLMTEAVNAVNRFWFEELKQPILRTKKASEKRGIARHLCPRGNALRRQNRRRLRLGLPADRALGAHSRRLAQNEPVADPLCELASYPCFGFLVVVVDSLFSFFSPEIARQAPEPRRPPERPGILEKPSTAGAHHAQKDHPSPRTSRRLDHLPLLRSDHRIAP